MEKNYPERNHRNSWRLIRIHQRRIVKNRGCCLSPCLDCCLFLKLIFYWHCLLQKEYFEREMEKRFIRRSPLGKDRDYNNYWWFCRYGRIFVESCDSKKWGYYSSKEEVLDENSFLYSHYYLSTFFFPNFLLACLNSLMHWWVHWIARVSGKGYCESS